MLDIFRVLLLIVHEEVERMFIALFTEHETPEEANIMPVGKSISRYEALVKPLTGLKVIV